MGGKNKAPASPDYSGIIAANAQAAQNSYALGTRQQDWAERVYEENKGRSQGIMDQMLQGMTDQFANARKDRERYETLYQPLEDELIKGAKEAGSEEKLAHAAGKAKAGVAQQFQQARSTAQENLEKFGVDPSQTRGQALDYQSRIAEAAASAGAGTAARDKAEMLAIARQTDMANFGKGYPGQVNAAYQSAASQGTGAQNVGLATTASGAQTMGTGTQWQALGNQSLGQQANAQHMGFQDQMARFNANQNSSSGWGAAAGFAGSFLKSFIPGMSMFGQTGGAIPGPPTTAPQGPQAGVHDGVNVHEQMSPSRGNAPDDVNAQLTAGEFIIPKDVAAFKGEEFFQKLIQNSRKQKMQAPAQPTPGAPTQPGPPQINTQQPQQRQAIPAMA